jgi:4-amino-4-deoxy-L-arabinose transferase-like glycosyltransferase
MRYLRVHWGWILLTLAALLPRLWGLDRFITADEILFLDHARQFLRGLASGDFSLTLGIGYPGVTLAWVNALGLLALFGLSRLGLGPTYLLGSSSSANLSLSQFLDGAEVQPLPYYVAGRVATALLVTALLLLFYALARRLFAPASGTQGSRDGQGDVALLGALLLALDPFMLGYSRLMHIAAPLALLMLLAVLAWLLWLQESRKGWLWLTGLFTGLAVLTKTTALLLPPLLLGLSGVMWLSVGPLRGVEPAEGRGVGSTGWRWWSRVLIGWLGVVGIAALIFFALWPAAWQDPGAPLALTFDKLWVDKAAGEGNLGMFWMGRFVEDPGPAFYLVALLLKLSPLMLIGLVFSLVSLRPGRGRGAEWSLWAYALLYMLAMTIATKKSVRYMLPAFAAFAPLAAYGLLRLGRWMADWVPPWRKGRAFGRTPLLLGLGLLLLVFSLPYAPYYFSYYNPLLLGWRWAPKTILVGWGEGLGDAAHYLNRQPGAAQATVAAWYDWTFAPFFEGQALPLSSENAMRADYTVFYINQVQRNIPDPNLITYFQRRKPDHVVRLNGLDYAWVYPAISRDGPLPAGAIPVNVPMGGMVSLEGYAVRSVAPGQGLIVSLYWRALRSDLPDYFVYVRAVDGAGQIHARADSPPVMGFWPTSRWEAGKLVADEQVLSRPPETEPGTYRLEVGMYDPQTWAVLEPASGQRGEGGGLLLGEVTLP